MLKVLLVFPWKAVVYLLSILWLLLKFVFKSLWGALKIALLVLSMGMIRAKKRKGKDAAGDLCDLLDLAPPAGEKSESGADSRPCEKSSVTRIGSILPVEADYDLRTFTVLNNEGEMFRVNTAAPGPFHGPVWTRLLACYETRQTLRGRLAKPVMGKSGYPSGYQVNIGPIRAFLPNYHSLRRDMEQGINVRVAVLNVDPVTQRVTVSARAAYEMLFAHRRAPRVGEEVDALYWDFDDEHLYLLLPGNCVGKAHCSWEKPRIESCMGELGRCHVETLDEREREALVSLQDATPAVQRLASSASSTELL